MVGAGGGGSLRETTIHISARVHILDFVGTPYE